MANSANLHERLARNLDGAAGTTPVAVAGMQAGATQRQAAHLVGLVRVKGAFAIPLDRIEADPDQPRTEFDGAAIERLAESLRTRGQLQPIRVRWHEPTGLFRVMVGE